MKVIILSFLLMFSMGVAAEESIREQLDTRAAHIWHSIHNKCMDKLTKGELVEDITMAGPAYLACVSIVYEDLAKDASKRVKKNQVQM